MIRKYYDGSPELQETRIMGFLDPFRHELFIDDILVSLLKGGGLEGKTAGSDSRVILIRNCRANF